MYWGKSLVNNMSLWPISKGYLLFIKRIHSWQNISPKIRLKWFKVSAKYENSNYIFKNEVDKNDLMIHFSNIQAVSNIHRDLGGKSMVASLGAFELLFGPNFGS